MHMRCASTGGVQAESAEKAEAIEHLRAFGEFRNALIIHLLIEIQTRFVAREHIYLKTQSIQFNWKWRIELASDYSIRIRQTFKFARGEFITLDDRTWREKLLEHLQDHRFSLIHSQ